MAALYILAASMLFVALVILVLPSLASRAPTLEFFARSFLGWIMLSVCATYGVLISFVMRPLGYGGLIQWSVSRAFKWTMWWSAGVTFVVQGEEYLQQRPGVLISNHQTELDVLLLGCVFPKYTSVTAKKSLMWVPFLGWYMALSKTVFIDRGNSKTARAAFAGAAKTMQTERQNVYIFPEGTRSYYDKPEMLPFKKGAFHLAVQAQVPIVPIVVANYSNVLNIRRRRFTAGQIPVKVLPPIPTKGLTSADVDKLTASTRDKMLEELAKLTELARGQAVAVPESQADGVTKVSKVPKATGAEQPNGPRVRSKS